MFGLLSWLWDRASRVYEFFGSLYSDIRNAALSAWNWARQAATDGYTWARNYAYSLYVEAKAYALQQYNYAYYTILGYYDRAVAYALGLYNSLKAWAYGVVDSLSVKVYGFVNAVKGDLLQLLNVNKIDLTEWVKGLFGPVNTAIGLWMAVEQAVKLVVTTLTPDILSKLLNFAQSGYAFVSSFVESPIAVLWAILEPYLSDLASYWLGYAMGAVNVTLPAAPNLGASGGYNPAPGGTGPGPGAGGLAPPLSSLRVSGNTFNNPPGHMGIDFGLSMGQTVFACHSGVIEIAQDVGDGYANCVTIRGGDWWSRYAHLQGFYVKPGDTVSAGQPIASGDTTGNSTGPHLHLELKYKGQFVDPATIF